MRRGAGGCACMLLSNVQQPLIHTPIAENVDVSSIVATSSTGAPDYKSHLPPILQALGL